MKEPAAHLISGAEEALREIPRFDSVVVLISQSDPIYHCTRHRRTHLRRSDSYIYTGHICAYL